MLLIQWQMENTQAKIATLRTVSYLSSTRKTRHLTHGMESIQFECTRLCEARFERRDWNCQTYKQVASNVCFFFWGQTPRDYLTKWSDLSWNPRTVDDEHFRQISKARQNEPGPPYPHPSDSTWRNHEACGRPTRHAQVSAAQHTFVQRIHRAPGLSQDIWISYTLYF